MKKTIRNNYVDLCRGIGVILVILGHIGYIGIINKFFNHFAIDFEIDRIVHAFHMPLFFVISGFFIVSQIELAIT